MAFLCSFSSLTVKSVAIAVIFFSQTNSSLKLQAPEVDTNSKIRH